jgi:hypothetical protein
VDGPERCLYHEHLLALSTAAMMYLGTWAHVQLRHCCAQGGAAGDSIHHTDSALAPCEPKLAVDHPTNAAAAASDIQVKVAPDEASRLGQPASGESHSSGAVGGQQQQALPSPQGGPAAPGTPPPASTSGLVPAGAGSPLPPLEPAAAAFAAGQEQHQALAGGVVSGGKGETSVANSSGGRSVNSEGKQGTSQQQQQRQQERRQPQSPGPPAGSSHAQAAGELLMHAHPENGR